MELALVEGEANCGLPHFFWPEIGYDRGQTQFDARCRPGAGYSATHGNAPVSLRGFADS